MNRALAISVVLLVAAAAYVVLTKYQGPTSAGDAATSTPTSELEITTASEREETDTYTLDAKYPQFGVERIDAEIERLVGLLVATFKKDVADAGPSLSIPYDFQSDFESVYVGADIVSAKIVTSTYTGGAHGIVIVNGLNFDRNTGELLTLDDALAMTGLTLAQISEKAKSELQKKLGADIIAPEGAGPDPNNFGAFIIDKDKVTFIFQVYQVAPYAAGPQEVSFDRKL